MAAEREHFDLLVVADAQSAAERFSSTLRNAGHAARVTWAGSLEACEKQLRNGKTQVLCCFLDLKDAPLELVVELRDAFAPGVPIIGVARQVDENAIAKSMKSGARDLISPDHGARLVLVVLRELEVFERIERLRNTEETIQGYQSRFESLLSESNDAIAYVQDGIVSSANPAFLERFGFASNEDIEGNPVMDLFEGGSQGALKDALRAVLKGKDPGDIELTGRSSTGKSFPAKTQLRQVEMDGETCIELAIRAEADTSAMEEKLAKDRQALTEQAARATRAMQEKIEEVGRRDPLTGLYHRSYFVEVLTEELKREEKSAARGLLYIKPDKFGIVEERIGLLESDRVLHQLAEIIAAQLADSDLPARFGGNIYTAVVVRSNFKDIEAIAERIRDVVAKKIFSAGSGSTPMTVSIGIADLATSTKGPAGAIAMAQQAIEDARKAGGNRVKVWVPAETDKEGKVTDAGWVKRITAALKDDRFQLAFQGIASLQGDATDMLDVLVRMIGEDGAEILPAEFMPAAGRNGLMVGIDRWIVINALKVAVERTKTREETKVFLRISDQTLADPTFSAFLGKSLAELSVPKGAVVLQVAEKSVAKYLKETQALASATQQMGCGFALEHFGIGHEPLRLLDYFKPDFVKVDGSFMQVIDRDEGKRNFVKTLMAAIKEKGIRTIAERVESANTMALLWGLGADFIQGNYVQEPEVILSEATAPGSRPTTGTRR
jgi:diguanylate cyclase (GGDEF)-like protein/PAS domain S-box-containing protein